MKHQHRDLTSVLHPSIELTVQSGSWPLHIFHVYERSKKHQLFCKGGASISASSNILGSIKLRNRIIQIRLY